MTELGHPEFYITPKIVAEQSKHTTAECRDCHLGNGRATDKDKAHNGMLKMLVIGEESDLKERKVFYPTALTPTGPDRFFRFIPKVKMDDGFRYPYEVRTILWNDRNPETYNFDPELSPKNLCQIRVSSRGIQAISNHSDGNQFPSANNEDMDGSLRPAQLRPFVCRSSPIGNTDGHRF